MLIRLLALFILVPLVELFLLLRLADLTSWWTTLGLVIITGVIGSILARREGLRAWRRFHAAMADGRAPSGEIQDGLMIVFAAALLLTPGLLTDALGFTLLIPIGREFIRKVVLRRYLQRFQVQVVSSTMDGFGGADEPLQPLNRTTRYSNSSRTIDATDVRRKA